MAEPFKPAPPEVRAAVARLMRETDTSTRAIALTTGLSASTIRDWNRKEGWRPLRIRRRSWEAALPRLAVLERLSRPRRGRPRAGPEAGSESLPAPAQAEAAREPAGEAARSEVERGEAERGEADLPTLRANLRAHVGRQIAAFDAALRGEGAAVIDSARVLRDLGGLKRLLDDLEEGSDDGHHASSDFRSDLCSDLRSDLRPLDLPALRESIARRYARLSDERPDAGFPGGPAGGAPAGAVA